MKYARGFLFFLSTVVLYLGLPLLGWGLGDVKGFLSLAPRAGYALIVAAFGLAVGLQAVGGTEGIRGKAGEEGKRVGRQTVVRFGLSLLLFAVLVFLPLADRRGWLVMNAGQPVRWAGLALAGIGMALVFWSGVALGRMYSAEVTVQEDHHLVTDGPYGLVRHPRYLGVILLGLGAPLVFRSWIGLAAAGLLVAVLLFRIRDEEALMHQAFGQEWESYCRRSRRLIPFVY